MNRKIVLGILCLFMSFDYDEQFDRLYDDLGGLRQQIEQLNGKMATLKQSVVGISELETELNNLSWTVSDLENSELVGTLLSGLGQLQNVVDGIKNDLGPNNEALFVWYNLRWNCSG